MKKILALLLAMLMVLSLCACGAKEEAPAEAPAAEAPAEAPAEEAEEAPAVSANLTMGTGGESGTYYAFGGVLASYLGQETDISVNVVSTGGSLKTDVLAQVGPHALRTVGSYHAAYAILSCRGINEQLGLADSDEAVVQIKQAMIGSCDRSILLADHRKFDRSGLVALGSLGSVDMLITDTAPSPQWQERLQNAGVELICGETE